MPPFRLNLESKGTSSGKEVKDNVKKARKYKRVEWGVLLHKTCAVVGGGPSTARHLETLRAWEGDIFAINDTAKFLSDNGIPCYVYSIDGTTIPFKIGPLVKGAVFATRVNRIQFRQFTRSTIRVFDMYEDNKNGGIEGGPTGVCRTPHLFLKMGYRGMVFFGVEGSFYGKTHLGGNRNDAFWNMVIVRINGMDYVTNAAFIMQCEYLATTIKKYPTLLTNASGGLLDAMLKDPDTWEVVAVTGDLKKQYDDQGVPIFNREYNLGGIPIWQPPETLSPQRL